MNDVCVALTDDQAKALQTIRDQQIRSAGEFLRAIWPNRLDWLRLPIPDRVDVAPGSLIAAEMHAATYLGDLLRDGLLKPFSGGFRSRYELSDAGQMALSAWENAQAAEEL